MPVFLTQQLVDFFRAHADRGASLALLQVEETKGSTYSKAGDLMLVNEDGDWHGMLSGGCLEGDLSAYAVEVISSGEPKSVTYNLADDDVFGLGVGCEGTISIAITPLVAEDNYEQFAALVDAPETRPRRLLLLGTGQDALPLVAISRAMGWSVTSSGSLDDIVSIEDFDAAVVMSHNLEKDSRFLRALSATSIRFVGLLGPPHRRDRILGKLTDVDFGDRLHAPVGIQIGGRGPAAIALEIVAELQAWFTA